MRRYHEARPGSAQGSGRVRRVAGRVSLVAGCLVAFVFLAAISGFAAMAAERAGPKQSFSEWIKAFKAEALGRGISARTLEAAFADVTLDDEILGYLENQPEHASTVAAYLGFAVSPERIEAGREKLAEHAAVLTRIEARYGVDRHVLIAIWGLESTYGEGPGERHVVRSLATLAYSGGRREGFWRSQLMATLQILERGDIAPDAMLGSWAGAMGHTQFIPTTYNSFAVDFDGDGRRDIWNSVADALASTANYLRKSGWRPGEPWGFEAVVPKNFDYALSGRRNTRTLGEWSRLGVRRAGNAKDLRPATRRAGLILPMGANGPAFLIFKNFYAILRYNQSTAYALAIGHLADRLRGAKPFERAWPKNERALLRAEREELQRLLVARGFSTGGVDGILGPMTRAAVRSFQRAIGLPADGYPSSSLLERLRLEAGREPAAKEPRKS